MQLFGKTFCREGLAPASISLFSVWLQVGNRVSGGAGCLPSLPEFLDDLL